MKLAVGIYAGYDDIYVSEMTAFDFVAEQVRGKRILDIGVGGGRTTPTLLELSDNYLGIDYVQDMVDACKERFAGVRFEHADARAMPQFADHAFDFIVFSSHGLCMVDHAGRIEILREVRRLLAPGGVFLFTTYNRNCVEHDQWFSFPEFTLTKNPIRLAVRSARFLKHTLFGAANRLRFKRLEVFTPEYSIINDRCHDYRTMLYYITLEEQHKQLHECGFHLRSTVFSGSGALVDFCDGQLGDSLLFVVQG